jgi:hypothetical protein
MDGERSEDVTVAIQKGAVSLWDILTLLSFSGALGGALAAASGHHASGLRLVLLGLWGVLLGFGSVVCARAGGGRLCERALSHGPGETLLALVYVSAGAWIFVSAPIAFLLTSGLIRLLP